MNFTDKPVFLCGAPRSGTTLLHTLLDAHPDILSVPIENHIMDKYCFYKQYGSETLYHYFLRDYPENFDVAIFSNPDYQPFLIERAKARFGDSTITSFFKNLTKTTATEFKDIYRTELHKLYKNSNNSFSVSFPYKALTIGIVNSFCEKTDFKYFLHRRNLVNEAQATRLKEAFPEAKFIHILRDPRTRYLSAKSRDISKTFWGYKFCQNIHDTDFVSHRAMVSLFSFELAERNQQLIKEDYLIIRYEDLIQDRKNIMKKISDFLSIEFKEILLTPTNMMGEPVSPNSSFKESSSEVEKETGKRLKKYFQKTSDLERFLLSHYCGLSASKYGYKGFDVDERISLVKALEPMKYEHFKDYIRNRLTFRKLNKNIVWRNTKILEKFQGIIEKGIEVKM